MTTRWEREDFWPELDYARPPRHQRVDWFMLAAWVLLAASSLLVWSLILWIIWEQVS